MNFDDGELPESVRNFILKLEEYYNFDDMQVIIHMVDLIEKYKMENFGK